MNDKQINKIIRKKYSKELLALGLISVGGLFLMGFQFFQNYYIVAIGIALMLCGNFMLKDYG